MRIAPRARREGLVVQRLPEETLVYDLERHRAHCLNRAASVVWSRCDGRTSLAELARIVGDELGIPADEGVVLLALDRLRRARLLEPGTAPRAGEARYPRRELARRLGVAGAALLLPAVTSVVAPHAVQAATCVSISVGGVCPTGTSCGALCGSCSGTHHCTPSAGNPTCKCQGGATRCNPPTTCP